MPGTIYFSGMWLVGLAVTEKWVINNELTFCYNCIALRMFGSSLINFRWSSFLLFCSGVAAAVLDGRILLQPAVVSVDSGPVNAKGGGGRLMALVWKWNVAMAVYRD